MANFRLMIRARKGPAYEYQGETGWVYDGGGLYSTLEAALGHCEEVERPKAVYIAWNRVYGQNGTYEYIGRDYDDGGQPLYRVVFVP